MRRRQHGVLDARSVERLETAVLKAESFHGQQQTPQSRSFTFGRSELFLLRDELVNGGTAVANRVAYNSDLRTYCAIAEQERVVGISGQFRWPEGSIVTALHIPGVGYGVVAPELVAEFVDGTKIADVPPFALLAVCPGQTTLPGAIPVCKPGYKGRPVYDDHYLAAGDQVFRFRLGSLGPEYIDVVSCRPLPAWVAYDTVTKGDGTNLLPTEACCPKAGKFTVGAVDPESDTVEEIRGYKERTTFVLNDAPNRENSDLFYHRFTNFDWAWGTSFPLTYSVHRRYYWRVCGFSADPKVCWVVPKWEWHRKLVAVNRSANQNFDLSVKGLFGDGPGRIPFQRIAAESDLNGNYR